MIFVFLFWPWKAKPYKFYNESTQTHMGQNQFTISQNNLILIQNSLFFALHSTDSKQGGAVLIKNQSLTIKFQDVGFYQCSTQKQYGGALLLDTNSIDLTDVCAGECVATDTSFQFAYLKAIQASFLLRLTIHRCGYENNGKTAIAICGNAMFYNRLINSTYNFNQYDTKSYGCCFSASHSAGFQTYNINFGNSCGTDAISTLYNDPSTQGSLTCLGNIFNCTGQHLMSFGGSDRIDTCYFSSNNITHPFYFSGTNQSISSLTLNNCLSDIEFYCLSSDGSNATNFQATYVITSPVPSYHQEYAYNELCHGELPIPDTLIFSVSLEFSASNSWSLTNLFVMTPSLSFTPSNPFTPSFSFKPEQTKMPDGLMNQRNGADVFGDSDKPATSAQIGATTGVSFVIIIVAVVLMLLYLRNKRKQMKNEDSDFMWESGSNYSDDDYSYSYYTFTYSYYTCDSNDQDEVNVIQNDDVNNPEEEDFQSFDPGNFDQGDLFAWQSSHTTD